MSGDIESLIRTGAEMLADAGIPEPRREAASLIAWAMKKDRAFLIAHPELVPPETDAVLYLEYLSRRATHEPFHYITGTKEFFGLEFKVTPAVLIPRPETEMLVERALEFFVDRDDPTFCELGVGSGCISISILAHALSSRCVGLEASEAAISVAQENAVTHRVDNRLELRSSDLFQALEKHEKFDLIVSNPPYISRDEFAVLAPTVREFEPELALTDRGDGLSVTRWIITDAPKYLRGGGRLLLELGHDQADEVVRLLKNAGWNDVGTYEDLQGIKRVVSATFE